MDAVEFLKAKWKMCNTALCADCPLGRLNNGIGEICDTFTDINPDKAVACVEKWVKEHPIVTNRQKFEEVFEQTFGIAYYHAEANLPWWEREYNAPIEKE